MSVDNAVDRSGVVRVFILVENVLTLSRRNVHMRKSWFGGTGGGRVASSTASWDSHAAAALPLFPPNAKLRKRPAARDSDGPCVSRSSCSLPCAIGGNYSRRCRPDNRSCHRDVWVGTDSPIRFIDRCYYIIIIKIFDILLPSAGTVRTRVIYIYSNSMLL